jgi:xanthine/CO dehydrogenase XdhC/CoxF family maturation factor
VVDDTPAVDPARYPDAAEIIGDDYDYGRLAPGPDDCVVIATQHKGDHLSAVRALRSPARCIAVIASRKRARLVLDFLREQGFPDEELARVRAVGFSDGEVAEIIAHVALNVLTNYFNRAADTEIDFPQVTARQPV